MFLVTLRLGSGLSAVLLLTSTLCWAPGSGGSPQTTHRSRRGARAASPPRGAHGHTVAKTAAEADAMLQQAMAASLAQTPGRGGGAAAPQRPPAYNPHAHSGATTQEREDALIQRTMAASLVPTYVHESGSGARATSPPRDTHRHSAPQTDVEEAAMLQQAIEASKRAHHGGGAAAAPQAANRLETVEDQLAYLDAAATNGKTEHDVRPFFEHEGKIWYRWHTAYFQAAHAWYAIKEHAPSPAKLKAHATYMLKRSDYILYASDRDHDQSVHMLDKLYKENWPLFYEAWRAVYHERAVQKSDGLHLLETFQVLVPHQDEPNRAPTWALLQYYLGLDTDETRQELKDKLAATGITLTYLSCPRSGDPAENARHEGESLTPLRTQLAQALQVIIQHSDAHNFHHFLNSEVFVPYASRDARETTHCLRGMVTRFSRVALVLNASTN